MNKNYKNILLQQKNSLFHTQDLASLWYISNRNTLYTTISRYTRSGVLLPIYKNFYATQPLSNFDPHELGLKALHRYGYVSCETMLARYGLINHVPREITLVSDQSKRFTVGQHAFRSRKMKDAYLFNPAGIVVENGIRTATEERAVADMLYFNPRLHLDAPIDWKKVYALQKYIGFPISSFNSKQ